MATAGLKTKLGPYSQMLTNRANTVPFGKTIISANSATNAATGYNSRVLAAQTNGAGPVANPNKAPWSLVEFITGQRSVKARPGAGNVGQVRKRGR